VVVAEAVPGAAVGVEAAEAWVWPPAVVVAEGAVVVAETQLQPHLRDRIPR
jgi:hypothetical protein